MASLSSREETTREDYLREIFFLIRGVSGDTPRYDASIPLRHWLHDWRVLCREMPLQAGANPEAYPGNVVDQFWC